MSTRARPAWTDKYLRYDAWTQNELRNLLCGLPPNPASDTPIAPDAPLPSRQEINDRFVREELLRVEVDRYIRDGVTAGRLRVLTPPDEGLLAKLASSLTPDEVHALRRALAHERACSKSYLVAPETAIRWAGQRTELFPAFPFEPADLVPARRTGGTAAAPSTLKEHRQQLVDVAIRSQRMTKTEFCRKHGLTMDILRGVVAADERRADLERWTPKVLNLLGISAETWDGG